MTAARACESCHKDKGKCIFADASAACSRCLRLDRPCKPRVARRMGRPPVARTMSHGNYLVMDLDSHSPAAGPAPSSSSATGSVRDAGSSVGSGPSPQAQPVPAASQNHAHSHTHPKPPPPPPPPPAPRCPHARQPERARPPHSLQRSRRARQ
ncbi:C6 transcription factor GliZ [Microdochium nivale]|nr:C6 transcription factor GliZ [Microdochium nivale]